MRWMCGVTVRMSKQLRNSDASRVGIENISEAVVKGRLCWFGHEERKEENNWAKRVKHFEAECQWLD